MSNSTMPKDNDELFDELDDLLDRMLALPVFPEDQENAPPSVPKTVEETPPEPVATAPLPTEFASYEAPETEKQEALPAPVVDKPAPPLEPVVETPVPPPLAPPRQQPTPPPIPKPEQKPIQDTNTETESKPEFIFPKPRYPIWQRPMVWINRTYDWFTSWFGSFGRRIQQGDIKNWMGVVGLGLLSLAIWLFLNEWLRWT